MSQISSDHVKRERGKLAYLSGQAAENIVATDYEERGLKPLAKRWRGGRAEIDLIFADGDAVVFVEVKKSRTHHQAAEALRPNQIQRIMRAATVYVADQPNGQMTDMRFDVALVDDIGQTKIIENAFLAA